MLHIAYAAILHYIGSSAFDIFETLTDTGDEKDYKKAMDRLTEHFTPQRNVDYRHYTSLEKKMKKNPNVMIVNMYLNKEYQARRDWLESISAENRCQQLLAMHPCFTDHVEV